MAPPHSARMTCTPLINLWGLELVLHLANFNFKTSGPPGFLIVSRTEPREHCHQTASQTDETCLSAVLNFTDAACLEKKTSQKVMLKSSVTSGVLKATRLPSMQVTIAKITYFVTLRCKKNTQQILFCVRPSTATFSSWKRLRVWFQDCSFSKQTCWFLLVRGSDIHSTHSDDHLVLRWFPSSSCWRKRFEPSWDSMRSAQSGFVGRTRQCRDSVSCQKPPPAFSSEYRVISCQWRMQITAPQCVHASVDDWQVMFLPSGTEIKRNLLIVKVKAECESLKKKSINCLLECPELLLLLNFPQLVWIYGKFVAHTPVNNRGVCMNNIHVVPSPTEC